MKEESLKLIQKVIANWKSQKFATYQTKEVRSRKSLITEGEYQIRFINTLQGFYCKGKEIPITLTSVSFNTTTFSENPLSDNPNSDAYRLEKFLSRFDEDFSKLIDEKVSECDDDTLFTSDPLFFV